MNEDIISKIHIWDTAGQERFRSIATNYINQAIDDKVTFVKEIVAFFIISLAI